MVTVHLAASDASLTPVELRAMLRAVARRTGKRYAEARDCKGRVVAAVEV